MVSAPAGVGNRKLDFAFSGCRGDDVSDQGSLPEGDFVLHAAAREHRATDRGELFALARDQKLKFAIVHR